MNRANLRQLVERADRRDEDEDATSPLVAHGAHHLHLATGGLCRLLEPADIEGGSAGAAARLPTTRSAPASAADAGTRPSLAHPSTEVLTFRRESLFSSRSVFQRPVGPPTAVFRESAVVEKLRQGVVRPDLW